jgi:rod shape determining protein RodA
MTRRVNTWLSIDWMTVFIYLALVFIGWISVYAAVFNAEHSSIFDVSQRYGKQLLFIVAAIVIAVAIMLIEGKFFSVFAYVMYGVSIISLLAVLVIGVEINNARSWFQIGSLGLQPAEFTKVAVALALSHYLSTPNLKINSFKVLFRTAVILFLPVGLIMLQPDTGSAIVFFIFLLVLFREGLSVYYLLLAALMGILFLLTLYFNELVILLVLLVTLILAGLITLRRLSVVGLGVLIVGLSSAVVWLVLYLSERQMAWHFILLLGIGISSPIILFLAFRFKVRYAAHLLIFFIATILYTTSVDYVFDNVLKPHQQRRINIMLGIESDPLGYGYNLNQSKIAIGSGGFSGKGFLQGTQTKFNFVPEQTTDFIFCTIGEEWGFLGSFLFISLYAGLLLRLIFLAERQRSPFSRIYGYSLIAVLFFHFFVNVGMTIGLVPVIGIPLPFISYGGSSLWAFTIMLFIFLKLDVSRLEMLK